jgi:P27 family predicted phage terminase small subunit
MPPHATPIELRRLRGNPSKRPIPNGVRPPPTPDVPDPPDSMKGWARKEWLRLAPTAHALGVLTELDLPAFAIVCQTLGHWHEAEELAVAALAGDPAKSCIMAGPLLKTAAQYARDSFKFLAEFGMTPAGRTKVEAPEYRGGGKFAGLLAGWPSSVAGELFLEARSRN